MNILPKKRWHVRTKENIARVRRDEAEAAEKERQEKIRIENANREARLRILKQKSKQKLLQYNIQPVEPNVSSSKEHVNLFADVEHANQSTNIEHDKEIKEKKEEYEKKIGYLTYLGQDTNEALGKKNWYDVPPESRFLPSCNIKDTYEKLVLKDEDGKPKQKIVDDKNGEIAWKAKQSLDPLNLFKQYSDITSKNKYLKDEFKKKKDKSKLKHKNKDKDISRIKLLKLREERLKREQQEKLKTKMFLAKLNGAEPEDKKEDHLIKVKPKYNSQFNPELARQNYR